MNVGSKVISMISIIAVTIVALACTPTVVEQVTLRLLEAEAAATEWNFTGAEGAKALLGLVPFIWIASILVMCAVGMFAVARSDGE